jgi:hypothetical protein
VLAALANAAKRGSALRHVMTNCLKLNPFDPIARGATPMPSVDRRATLTRPGEPPVVAYLWSTSSNSSSTMASFATAANDSLRFPEAAL